MSNKTPGLAANLPRLFVLGVVGLGAVAAGYKFLLPSQEAPVAMAGDPSTIVEPDLTPVAAEGKTLFNDNCAACHGEKGAGTEQGPPFIHAIYNPGHHGDEAFYYAAQNGVRQHHWPFGNMPAQPQVGRDDVAKIITYVREVQTANGIGYQAHSM